jgi:hypothetical protein
MRDCAGSGCSSTSNRLWKNSRDKWVLRDKDDRGGKKCNFPSPISQKLSSLLKREAGRDF